MPNSKASADGVGEVCDIEPTIDPASAAGIDLDDFIVVLMAFVHDTSLVSVAPPSDGNSPGD